MKLPSFSFAALGLLFAPLTASATQTPYYDSFETPPYFLNTSVVGQNGWVLNSGNSSQANIISDPTGSGRGNVLQILNGTGTNYGDVTKTFPAITTGDAQISFDIYGDLPGTDVTPDVQFKDSTTGKQVVLVEPLGASYNYFNVNNSAAVPNITPQASTWYTVTILFHMATSTFDITITDGTHTGSLSAVPFWSSGIARVDEIEVWPIYGGSYANGRGLFDNFSQPVPYWANNIGIDTVTVPFPWTNVVPSVGNPTSTFDVSQREYTYTNTLSLLPSQISALGQNLLSGPIQLTGTPTTNISLTQQSATAQTANFTTTNGTASVSQSLSFDGMLWCEVTLPAGTYSSLGLSIPITLANSTLYCNYAGLSPVGSVEQVYGSTPSSVSLAWQNSVWIGNESQGLTYFAESNQNWSTTTSKPVSIVRNGTNTTLTATFINKSTTYATPPVFRFGFQATPVRPLLANWQQLQFLDALPNTPLHSNLYIAWWSSWCPYIGDPFDANAAQMQTIVAESHSLGIKTVPYIPLANLNSALPILTPYGNEWLVEPSAGGGGEDNQTLTGIGSQGSAADYYIYGMNQMLAAAPWDGIYFDGTAGPLPDDNTHHNQGYMDSSGTLHTTFDVRGQRAFLFRTMMMFNDNYHISDPIMIGHMSYGLLTPMMAMCNVWVDGEQYESQTSNDYTQILTLAQFRAHFMAQKFGAVPIMLPELGNLNSEWLQGQVSEATFDTAIDTLLIFPMLHGTLWENNWLDFTYIQPLLDIRRTTFGTSGFVGYWLNSPSIQVSPVVTTLQASAYTMPDKLLVVVANLSASSTTAAVTLNLAALAPNLTTPTVTDILTGHGTQSLSGNVLTASVPAKSLRVIEISNPIVIPIPNLVSATSIQTHAGTNFLPINLPVTGNQGVECRETNGSLELVLTFDQPMTSGTVAVTDGGDGTLSSTPSFNGNTVTIAMNGVSDAQNVTVTVSGLNGTTGTASLTFGVLVGDVNGDGAVNSQDLIGVRNALGTQVGGAGFNPADDINEDGAVNSQDLIQVRNRLGNQLP